MTKENMTNPNVIRLPQRDIKRAVAKFPTPFFFYDEKIIRYNCQRLKRAFGRYFKNFKPLYAVKANANPYILKIIINEGFGMDASSEAESYIAKKLGSWGMYTGNYTTEEEFRYVLQNKKMLINLDDISMIPTLKKLGMPKFISFRINPGISKAKIKSNVLAGPDAKYGIPWEQAADAYRQAVEAGAKKFGIHMMTGSNILDEDYFFAQITKKLLEIAGDVKKELGIDFEYLNIGGGFGVPYKPQEKTLDLNKIARNIRKVFDAQCKKFNLKEPILLVEPGRLIMADAGFLVAKVNVIKNGYKKFVGVDAGMNDQPRPAIYDAYHHITVLGANNKGVEPPIGGSTPSEKVNVVGRLCENNDQFAVNRLLPKIKVGDVLVIHNSGAHSYSMGHNYNGRLRSAEYLLTKSGRIKQIRRAETIQDLLRTIVR
jgi:diaminopimelate decarboxylase